MGSEEIEVGETYRELLKTLKKIAAEKFATDREAFGADLIGYWEHEAKNLGNATACVESVARTELTSENWRELNNTYAPFWLIYYAPLMDELTYDETERFLAAAEKLAESWREFFAAVERRHPELKAIVDGLVESHAKLHEVVVEMYTGERETALGVDWGRPFKRFTELQRELSKGLMA